jgi:hypothetical protein
MGFKTPDGKEFETRIEWRNYMMKEFYSFTGKKDEPEPLIKKPGDVDGQVFNIAECENSTLVVMDFTEQIQIDKCKNCRIFIGACASSIFIRDCEDCVFYTVCRQLRLRTVTGSKFYIYSMAEVHIEYSSNVQLAPFNGGYPEHAAHIKKANLNLEHNLWYDVFDHNDPNKTGENSVLIPRDQYEAPWFPAGPCEPCIALTVPNSVVRTDDQAPGVKKGQVGESYGADQLRADAAKVATEAPPVPSPKKAPSPVKETVVPIPAPVVEEMDADEAEAADAEGIFMVLKQFAGFLKGDPTDWATDDFSTVLTSNMWCDMKLFCDFRGEQGPRGDVESVESIERQGDVAWCTFAASGSGKTSINTAVVVRPVGSKPGEPWKIATVHSSLTGVGNES